jgi:hypothetical protein
MRYFVVLSQQRAGSHMLMNLLNSHPLVHCNSDFATADIQRYGEEWAYEQGFTLPPVYSDRAPLPPNKHPELVGFLIKFHQDLHPTIYKRQGVKIVLLRRQNQLATLLSRNVSHLLGPYDSPHLGVPLRDARNRRVTLPPIRIEPKAAQAFFEEWDAKAAEVVRCLEGTDRRPVLYEELCWDTQGTMRGVFEHLGVPFQQVRATPGWGAEKLDPRPLAEAIANYEELKAYFVGTRWDVFFREGE